MHFGTACLTVNFDKSDAFRLTQFLPPEAGDQLRIFADATPLAMVSTLSIADEFHRRSLVQRSHRGERASKPSPTAQIPSSIFARSAVANESRNVDIGISRKEQRAWDERHQLFNRALRKLIRVASARGAPDEHAAVRCVEFDGVAEFALLDIRPSRARSA